MTDEPPTGGADGAHLDLDTLAELDEGLLPAADAAGHESHLGGCRRCREHQARLRSTRALLAALPAEPMPPAVAARIDAALTGAAAATTVVPFDRPRRAWRNHPTGAGLGAAAAAVALITAIVVGSTLHSSKPRPDHGGAAIGAAAPQTETTADFPLEVAGRHYTPANAGDLVAAAVRSAAGARGTAAPLPGGAAAQPQVPPALQTLFTDREALLRCAAALSGVTPPTPIAVDFGYFTDRSKHLVNTPAITVVLPGPAGKADAYIVGPNCATAPDNNIYLFQRITRPS